MFAVPQFYIQVLHLMNKMSLPTPFEPLSIRGPFVIESRPPVPSDSNVAAPSDASDEEEAKEVIPPQQIFPTKRRVEKLFTKQMLLGKKPRILCSDFKDAPASGKIASRPGVASDQELERLRVNPNSAFIFRSALLQ